MASTVKKSKQKKVKAKAANPAKAPKVKKTLNTKKAQKVNNKPKVKGKKKLSTKLILIPVFVVGFVSVISSGLKISNRALLVGLFAIISILVVFCVIYIWKIKRNS